MMKVIAATALALVLLGCATPEPSTPQQELNIFEVQERILREKHLGKTKQELQAVFGSKVAGQIEKDTWEIWDHLGPGAHSFVWVTRITFKNDIAVEIKRDQKAVGCILVEPLMEK